MADIGWRTINGTHVYLSGKGTVIKGPAALVGRSASDLKNQSGALTYAQSSISALGAAYVAKNGDKVSKYLLSRAKEKERREAYKFPELTETQKAEADRRISKAVQSGQYNPTGNTLQPPKRVAPTKETLMYNGFEVPKEYFQKDGNSLTTAGKNYVKGLVRKDPTQAKDVKSVKSAYSAEFKKLGLSPEMQSDAARFLQQGKSLDQAVKMARDIEMKFKSFHK